MTIQEANAEMTRCIYAMDFAKDKYREAYIAFGKAFRERREQEKLSLREVARDLGVSPAYLSDVELGRRIANFDVRLYFSK
jgi:DNA-binding transcriptional regulator YiaG